MRSAECRHGHARTALGINARGDCVTCKRISQARYHASKGRHSRAARDARYAATIDGQITRIRAKVNYRIRGKQARIAMLEEMLHA